jgi:hypothetical protein
VSDIVSPLITQSRQNYHRPLAFRKSNKLSFQQAPRLRTL